jgi:hypothetical protein
MAWACFRGGKLRHFFWPAPLQFWRRWKKGGIYEEAREKVWQALTRWRLPYYFWLGLRGFTGALLWLFLPTTLLIAASRVDDHGLGVLIGLVGAASLALVLLYLPFLQANFAADGQWRSMFQIGRVRAGFRKAPIAHWIALLFTLVLAIPLYLLKAELIPREAAWLPSLFFIAFILPARWCVGWALARTRRRETPRHFVFRSLARCAAVPVVLIYVIIVYFTQYISWYGGLSLYEQHAFLLPVPFLGM